MSFGEKIKKLRLEKNWTQEYVADKLSISIPALSRYESGTYEPKSLSIISDFARLYGVTSDYLLGLNVDYIENDNSSSAIVFVYGTIPAGVPMEFIEDILDTEEIPSDMLKGGKQFFGLRVKGDSMFPDYLDGDTLIIEKADDCESGDDAVVMVNGNDGTFKRVFKNENGIILQPLNPTYAPMVYSNEQILSLPIKVLGVVVELRRKKK